jgi:PIN domain nuclease of toxin-antitoxin system
MTGAVVDTHALLWYLTGDAALSDKARSSIESADSDLATMYVSAISLVEIVYLIEKGRLSGMLRCSGTDLATPGFCVGSAAG